MMELDSIARKITGEETIRANLSAERLGSSSLVRIVEARDTSELMATKSVEAAAKTTEAADAAIYAILLAERDRMRQKLQGFQRDLQSIAIKRRTYARAYIDVECRPWEEEDALENEKLEEEFDAVDEENTDEIVTPGAVEA